MVFLIGKHEHPDAIRRACARCFPRNGTLCHFDQVRQYESLRAVTAKIHTDLIVIDLCTERDAHLSLIEKIRGDRRWDNVPVLAISEHTEDFGTALRAGANGYLTAPIDSATMISLLKKLR